MRNMTVAEFKDKLCEFTFGELKFMFNLCRKKDMLLYYGEELSKKYRSAIYDYIIKMKILENYCEEWED